MSGEPPAGATVNYQLRLFVAGSRCRSLLAIENLRRICDEHLKGLLDLEVIDVYQQPDLAEQYRAIAVPTLVKLLPLPVRRVVGDLSGTARVLRGLAITPLVPGGDVG